MPINTHETSQRQELLQYEITGDGFESKLQKIHNIMARHINVVIRELYSEEMTYRAALYLGFDQQEGQEDVFLDFISQVVKMIEDQDQTEQTKLDFLRKLLNNIANLKEMSPHIITDCTKQLDLEQKDIIRKQVSIGPLRKIRVPTNH